MLNKVREHFWFVYATKEKALEQYGQFVHEHEDPYVWLAYVSESEHWANNWIGHKNKTHNSNIIGLLVPGDNFIVLGKVTRAHHESLRTDTIVRVLSGNGLVGWVIQPHTHEGSSSFFEEIEVSDDEGEWGS